MYVILTNPLPTLVSLFIVIIIMLFILYYYLFCKYTILYPINKYIEYKYDPKTSLIGYKKDGNFVIRIMEKDKGIWIVEDNNEKMRFDMNGYIFSKSYISSYFIRNLHYDVINKNEYPLKKLFKSLSLSPFSKFQNVTLTFEYKNKIKKIVIVKNNKSKVTFLMKQILQSRYGILGGRGKSYNSRVNKYERINEKIYESERIRKTIIINHKNKK